MARQMFAYRTTPRSVNAPLYTRYLARGNGHVISGVWSEGWGYEDFGCGVWGTKGVDQQLTPFSNTNAFTNIYFAPGDKDARKWSTRGHVLRRNETTLSHQRKVTEKSLDKSV